MSSVAGLRPALREAEKDDDRPVQRNEVRVAESTDPFTVAGSGTVVSLSTISRDACPSRLCGSGSIGGRTEEPQ